MAVLNDGDFELDGFLLPSSKAAGVYVNSFEMGGVEVRDQDTPNPVGDNVMFGRDYYSPEPWLFTIRIRKESLGSTIAAFETFSSKILGSSKRATPGAVSVLRFNMGGVNRRIWGRARGLKIITENAWAASIIDAEFRFDPQEAIVQSDVLESLSIPIYPGEAGGFTTPLRTPLTTVSGGERIGLVTNTGTAPAPFVVVFKGPITNPCLRVGGKEIKLLTTLAPEHAVTVDTRAMTVTRNGGANLSGSLSRASRLSTARLAPGNLDFGFSGIDLSGMATATVSWYPAYTSL